MIPVTRPFLIACSLILLLSCSQSSAPRRSGSIKKATETYQKYVLTHEFSPLTGNGELNRPLATYADLFSLDHLDSPIDNRAYTVPKNAANPTFLFEGTLELLDLSFSGQYKSYKDKLGQTRYESFKHLPPFKFEFVQYDGYLIPKTRGLIETRHEFWDYFIGPGRVWKEAGDNGLSRASFPFSLRHKNQDALMNGVMMFLFDNQKISNVWYQITQETSYHFQADLWGIVRATYHPHAVKGKEILIQSYKTELKNRLPTRHISDLPARYPGVNHKNFGNRFEVSPRHMTLFGFVIDGVNYVGGFQTRYGCYPYPGSMRVPAYSVAKSFTAIALTRAEKLYPGLFNEKLSNWIPEATPAGWGDVRVGHALDMRTGHYRSNQYYRADEDHSSAGFFRSTTHQGKLNHALSDYPKQMDPDKIFIYRTSDSYLALTAARAYFKKKRGPEADIIDDLLFNDMMIPLNLSPGSLSMARTYDNVRQPFGGNGLWFVADDIAKFSRFLLLDKGKLNGVELLDSRELNAAFQKNAQNRGSYISQYDIWYKNGFWAYDFSKQTKCPNAWGTYMSGISGNIVLMMPNDTVYYYFSDREQFNFSMASRESHKIRPFCR